MTYKHWFIMALLSGATVMSNAQSDGDKIKSIESNLMTSFIIKGHPIPTHTISDRMKYHRIPGLSIAFIENNQVKWTRSYGVKRAGGNDPVTDETLFQAGSVSKPVAAAITLCVVKQGLLSLDNDVNTYLRSWKVPANRFTDSEKVSLRKLLSHSAGVTVHGFTGYPSGEKIPALTQILNGEAPAKNRKITVDTIPGVIWRYSGGGYTIVQQVLEDVTGKPFGQLAKEEVFSKLAMKHSTFQQPLSGDLEEVAATGHSVFGQSFDKNFVQPELAAGGLWTTPADLARFAIGILEAGEGKNTTILDQSMAGLMLTPQFKNWTLGLSVNGNALTHPGSCEGFRTILIADKNKAQGVVMMTNAENGDNLMREIINSIAKTYGWSSFSPREREMYALSPEIYKKYCGTYQAGANIQLEMRYEDNSLKVYMNDELRTTLFPETEKKFFILEDRHTYTFNTNVNGTVESVSITGIAPAVIQARKIL